MAELLDQALDELARLELALQKIWGLSGDIMSLHSLGDDTVVVRRERIVAIFDVSRLEYAVRGDSLRVAVVQRRHKVRRSKGSG